MSREFSVTVAGGALVGCESGEGVPVLVLHGGPMSDYTEPLVEVLPAGLRLSAISSAACRRARKQSHLTSRPTSLTRCPCSTTEGWSGRGSWGTPGAVTSPSISR